MSLYKGTTYRNCQHRHFLSFLFFARLEKLCGKMFEQRKLHASQYVQELYIGQNCISDETFVTWLTPATVCGVGRNVRCEIWQCFSCSSL